MMREMQRKDLDIFPSPRSPSRPGHNSIAGGTGWRCRHVSKFNLDALISAAWLHNYRGRLLNAPLLQSPIVSQSSSNEPEDNHCYFAAQCRTRVRAGSKSECAESDQGRRTEGGDNHQRRPSQDSNLLRYTESR